VQIRNVWQYRVTSGLPGVTAVQVLEGWWNHVKAQLRSIFPTSYTTAILTLELRELNNAAGLLGGYGVSPAEQAGTRAPGAGAEVMPFFNAASMRLNVGTRATRPGQKRFSCLVETDNVSGLLQASARTPIETMGAFMIASMTLGAPVATMTLQPIVTRKDAIGYVTAYQPIDDVTVANYISTQNSRKVGRGN